MIILEIAGVWYTKYLTKEAIRIEIDIKIQEKDSILKYLIHLPQSWLQLHMFHEPI